MLAFHFATRIAALLLTATLACPACLAEDWPQWGGAKRNFMPEAKGLASSWSASGPRQVWSRPLGEGYSAIAVEGGRLYTMYRESAKLWQFGKSDQEVVIAMDAVTGKTVWEYRYDAPLLPKMNMEYGPGPHATPLIVGDLAFTSGVTAKFHALDKRTGKVVWAKDFHQEYGTLWGRGYASSPIAYKNTVIVTLGGPGKAVLALNQKDGAVVWKKQDFDYGFASPILINVDGQDQLVVFMANEVAGVDPNGGEFLWSHPHKTDWGLNISTPVFWANPGGGNFLFCSSAYSGGSRLLQLSRAAGKTAVNELWFSNRMRIHIGNAIRIGDYVYGSSGDFGPAFFAAIEVKTGRIAWQDRSFARASSVYADAKFLILDEDGNLALASVSPQGLKVLSRVQLLASNAWTPPTLVGTRLYLRDRKTIRALELS